MYHEQVARGGMGRILLVCDERIGRDVALKELLPELTVPSTTRQTEGGQAWTAEAYRRFAHEARITGQLEHPYIVPVYEIDQREDGAPYYTMRYVRGHTFSDRLAESNSLDRRMVLLSNFLHVCQGIAYAHAKQIIHRDLKPSNVLVGEFGETVIVDWGLAKKIHQPEIATSEDNDAGAANAVDQELTQRGSRLGSPFYMAPERMTGDMADFRSDVYSLGVMLYEILTGRRPFEASDPKTLLHDLQEHSPIPPRQLDGRIPRDLETICLKALSRSPENRYPSAQELADDIERFQTGALVEAYSYSPIERIVRAYRAHRSAFLIALGSLVVLAITTVLSFHRIQQARDEALDARDREYLARLAAEDERYFALVGLAQHQLRSHAVDAARNTLSSVPADHEFWEWRVLANLSSQSLSHFRGFGLVRVSPDSTLLAGVGPREPLTIWNLDALEQRVVVGPELGIGTVNTFEFHTPTRSLVAGYQDGFLRAWDTEGGLKLAEINAGGEPVLRLWTATPSDRLIAATATGQVSVFTFDGREFRLVMESHALQESFAGAYPAQAGRADITLSGGRDGELFVAAMRPWNESEGVVCAWMGTDPPVLVDIGSKPVLLSDIGQVAYLRSGRAVIHDLYHPDSAVSWTPPDGVTDIDVTPDGRWLGVVTEPGAVYVSRVGPHGVEEAVAVDSGSLQPESRILGFGRHYFALLSERGPFRFFDPAVPGRIFEFQGHTGAVRRVELDPNAERLITTGLDEVVRTWPLNRPQPLETLITFPRWAHDLEFDEENNVFLAAGTGVPLQAIEGSSLRVSELLPGSGAAGGRFVAIAPGGRFVAESVTPALARIVDLRTGATVSNLGGHRNVISSIEFSRDGRRLLTASWDGSAKIWDRETGNEIASFDHGPSTVYVARWLDGGKRVLTATSTGTLHLWDAESTNQLVSMHAYSSAIYCVQPAEPAGWLAAGSDEGGIAVWNLDSLEKLAELVSGGSGVRSLALSPDGTRLISGHEDGTITAWNTSMWRATVSLRGHSAAVRDLKFTLDGNTLISAGDDGRVRAWRASPIGHDQYVGSNH